jgi:hypothetical protein
MLRNFSISGSLPFDTDLRTYGLNERFTDLPIHNSNNTMQLTLHFHPIIRIIISLLSFIKLYIK